MSWLFSQALVAEFLAGICSDGEQSVPSSGNPTQLAFLSHGKTTAFSRPSRFGMTFRPLTDAHGEGLLTWFLAASRARTSAWQAKVPASTATAPECGGTWRGWLAKFDPDTSSWKTAQCSFIEDSTESLETLPRSGMTRDGLLWELPTLERPTSATASGLWQTPVADDAIERAAGKWNSRGEPKLSAEVKLWPTPTSTLGTNGGRVTPSKAREGGTLIEALSARTKWPTPIANDAEKRGAARVGAGLPGAVEQSNESGMLNPTWVEWLMGWPLGWTDLRPLATARSLNAQPLPGDCSPLDLEAA